MSIFNIVSVLLAFTVFVAYINHRFFKLPNAVGLLAVSLFASILLLIAHNHYNYDSIKDLIEVLKSFDLNKILMGGMISFILFATAINVNFKDLYRQRISVFAFSTFSVLLSTFIIGTATYFLLHSLNIYVEFIYSLMFGALITPTDPIFVLSILREEKNAKGLETNISGESLFNNGVAVMIFIVLFEISEGEGSYYDFGHTAVIFIKEIVGGIAFGLVLGYLGYYLLKTIDDFRVEVMITLAIAMGGYTFTLATHISGHLAMVVAGLIIGNLGKEYAFKDSTRVFVEKFWELVEEGMNAILFVLIGLEIMIIYIPDNALLLSVCIIQIIFISRWISLRIPVQFIHFKEKINDKAVFIMVWGGLRGGLSLAMALSLEKAMNKDIFIFLTYVIVLFTIIIQGLTMKALTQALIHKRE